MDRLVAAASGIGGGDAGPPAPLRVQLFVNPGAGSWRLKSVAALSAAFEAAGAIVVVAPSVAGPLVVADGVDHACAVGGDGTARHVAAAIARAGRPVSMSVYPLGTVNLLARECGYVPDVDAFARRVVGHTHRRHHAALVGEVPMLTCASVGPDSHAVDRLSPGLKRRIGRAAYLIAFGSLLRRWPRSPLRVAADGREVRCEAIYVAKGRFFAGRWSFAPDAALDSPLLHVVAIERATRIAALRFAWSLLRGRPPRGVIRLTCTALTIDGDAAIPVQADGDIVARLPARIAIGPGTMTFC